MSKQAYSNRGGAYNDNITISSYSRARYAGTIRPRLESALRLIDTSTLQLQSRQSHIEQILNNSVLFDNNTNNCVSDVLEKSVQEIKIINQAIICLDKIRAKLLGISDLSSIPYTIACLIPVVRAQSSCIFHLLPICSKQLCRLATDLGSIVVDSAILTKTHCNFEISNIESNLILDEAKLISDSKIDKQYPNLETMLKNRYT